MPFSISNPIVLRTLLLVLLALIFSCSSPTNQSKSFDDTIQDKVIYEVNIRQYSADGNFESLTKDLPRLKKLGVDILWLMPIHPIGKVNRKGSMGSYYAVKDYKAVNPEFGTDEEFRNFVNSAHQQGFMVIIDWVANHTSWDNIWVESNPEWFTKDENGNFVPPVDDWADVIDLDFDQKEMRNAMTDAMKYWVEEFDIDGFRCDVASMVPTEFWDSTRVELDMVKPVFMLAEAEKPDLNVKAFHASYGWEMHHIYNMVAQEKEPAQKLIDVQNRYEAEFPEGTIFMNFTSNHDENSWNGTVFERMGDAHKTMAALSYVMPGMPLIYSGQEAPMKKRLEFFEKDAIDWDGYQYQKFYEKLNELKHSNAALHHGKSAGDASFSIIGENILVVERQKDESKVVGIFNLSSKEQSVDYSEISSFVETLKPFLSESEHIEHGKMDAWDYVVFSNN